ncbi:MAG: TraR/DksA family transcriptional regulator [Pirellulaceae bacterium]
MARTQALLKLRQLLVRRRDALRRVIAGDLGSLNELREQSHGDVLDAASDTARDELSCQLAEAESRELGQIDEALNRMRDGSYGTCDGCGKVIPVARLQIVPYATECIECKRKSEEGETSGGWSWQRSFNDAHADRV